MNQAMPWLELQDGTPVAMGGPRFAYPYDLKGKESFGYLCESRDMYTEDVLRRLESGEERLFATLAVAYIDSEGCARFSNVCFAYDFQHRIFVEYQSARNIVGAKLDLKEVTLPRRPVLEFEQAGVAGDFEANKEFRSYWGFSNNGASNAELVRLEWDYAVVPEHEVDRFLARSVSVETWQGSRPHKEIQNVLPLEQISLRGMIKPTAKDVENVLNGWKLLYIGRIEYVGSNDAPYWTNFCIVYDGNSFRAHHSFNKTGTGHTMAKKPPLPDIRPERRQNSGVKSRKPPRK